MFLEKYQVWENDKLEMEILVGALNMRPEAVRRPMKSDCYKSGV